MNSDSTWKFGTDVGLGGPQDHNYLVLEARMKGNILKTLGEKPIIT